MKPVKWRGVDVTYLAIFVLELLGQAVMGLVLGASIAWGMKLAGVRMTIGIIETVKPKDTPNE